MMVTFTIRVPRPSRAAVLLLAGLLGALAAVPATAQQGPQPQRAQVEPPEELFTPRVSRFGENLSNREAGQLLQEMRQLTEQALAASRAAQQAATVEEVKAGADRVFQAVWGMPSGMLEGNAEARQHGWKEKWQVTGAEFDRRWIERMGTEAPRITDPRQLGIMGRGRAVRGRLERMSSGSSNVLAAQAGPADGALASLNNVIGWTYMTTGLKVTEVQPRVSLTHVWDAPVEFWNSTADTGWLPEAYAQAINILKTNYAGDAAEAREHAAAMSRLLERVLSGVDADSSGVVEPKAMEGGLNSVLQEAGRAGLRAN
jgi:hypothetical protein